MLNANGFTQQGAMGWLERIALSAAAAALSAVITLLWLGDKGEEAPASTTEIAETGTPAALEALRARVAALEEQLRATVPPAAGAGTPPPLRAATTLASAQAAAAQPALSGDTVGDTAAEEDATQDAAQPSAGASGAALLEAGLGAGTAERVQQRIAEMEMARLYLRDRASREGWIDDPEFTEALNALESPDEVVRREFGDDVYDRYLYAMGQSNRVVIATTLYDSPAAAAGIRSGDLVLRYANERVFNLRDLRAATAGGQAGDTVVVELLRDGELVYTTVPRGPLGVRLDLRREPPAPG